MGGLCVTVLRVDAHHHLWDLSVRSQTWIDPVDMAPINRSFDLRDLAEAKAMLIDRTVVVEATSLVAETEELLATAAAEPLISGVVGYVDLTSPDVGEQIDRLRAGVGGDRLVGIRSPVQDESDPRWLERDDVIAGLRAVSARRPRLRPARVAAPDRRRRRGGGAGARGPLCRRSSGQAGDRRAGWEPWASSIAALAAFENVSCKLSGMVTEADWRGWSVDDLRPYADHVITAFGPDRLLFGSDWPVCLLAGSYEEVVSAAEQLIAELSEAERDAVLGANATRDLPPRSSASVNGVRMLVTGASSSLGLAVAAEPLSRGARSPPSTWIPPGPQTAQSGCRPT